MAYASTNLRLQSDSPLAGAGQSWQYRSSDTVATVMAANYISNALDMGMKIDDVVEIHDTTTPAVVWARVTANPTSSGAILATTASGTSAGVNEVFTALTTVGAATITAAAIVGGAVNRTGPTAAAVDTTDTAANIILAVPGYYVGQSWELTYYNNSLGQCTVTAAAGVTVTGGIVPGNQWVRFLVTIASATTVTMVAIAGGPCVVLPAVRVSTSATATLGVGDLTGGQVVQYTATGANATITTRTAAQMFADIPGCQIGYTYLLILRNSNASNNTLTAADGSVTLTGTVTCAQNTTRLFTVQFTSATAVTFTSCGVTTALA